MLHHTLKRIYQLRAAGEHYARLKKALAQQQHEGSDGAIFYGFSPHIFNVCEKFMKLLSPVFKRNKYELLVIGISGKLRMPWEVSTHKHGIHLMSQILRDVLKFCRNILRFELEGVFWNNLWKFHFLKWNRKCNKREVVWSNYLNSFDILIVLVQAEELFVRKKYAAWIVQEIALRIAAKSFLFRSSSTRL